MIRHKLEIFKNDLENPLNCKLVWTVDFYGLHRVILIERDGGGPGLCI